MAFKSDVAIIGYGFKLPGIQTENDFWDTVAEKRSLCTDMVESGRFDESFFDDLQTGNGDPMKIKTRRATVYRDVEWANFDPNFFNITAKEASLMDPDQRHLLLCSWECVDKAGIDALSLHRSMTGCFIGSQVSAFATFKKDVPQEYTMTGVSNAIFPARISHFYGLHGPSLVCNTACSATLTAMNVAIRSLEAKECTQAFVGGINSLYAASAWQGFSQLGVLSTDGYCKSFDKRADGYSRAEGSAVFLIKPLEAAKKEGNRIFGVIRGTLLNAAGPARGAPLGQPGRSMTTPSVDGQVHLMRDAYERAGIPLDRVSYIEAHGTGTVLGDQMECNAIAEVFGSARSVERPLRVASIKSNIGHMEGGSGTACILKALLMFQRRMFLPTASCTDPTPKVDWANSHLHIQQEVEPFDRQAAVGPDGQRVPVIVGINNFGFGGSNAHLILEEYIPDPIAPEPERAVPAKPSALAVPVSAKSKKALAEYAAKLADIDAPLRDLAGNLGIHRTHHALRRAFITSDLEDLRTQLRAFASTVASASPGDAGRVETAQDSKEPRVGFVFSGQGTQWEGCGRRLYECEPVFKATCDHIDKLFQEHAGWSLLEKMQTAPQAEIDECQVAQPLVFMVQVGLVELFRTWNVFPAVVIGHSAGEVAAVYASGALTLEDAVFVIYHRSRLQQTCAGSGRLLALGMSEEDAEEIIEGMEAEGKPLEKAAINAPGSSVLTGKVEYLEEVRQECEGKGIFARFVRGNIAFHSTAMEEIEEPTLDAMEGLGDRMQPITTPIISTVTGAHEFEFDEFYWYQNMRQPVLFAKAIETLVTSKASEQVDFLVEVGPHPALKSSMASCIDTYQTHHDSTTVLNAMARNGDDARVIMQTVARLWEAGVNVAWRGLFHEVAEWPENHHVELPSYPWQMEICYHKSVEPDFFAREGPYHAGPLIGKQIWSKDRVFELPLTGASFPFLLGHVVQGVPIVPAAGYLEMVMQALGAPWPIRFKDVQFEKTLPLKAFRFPSDMRKEDTSFVQIILQDSVASKLGGPTPFLIMSTCNRNDKIKRDVHSRGLVYTGEEAAKIGREEQALIPDNMVQRYLDQGAEQIGTKVEDFYDRLSDNWGYRDMFRVSEQLWYEPGSGDYMSCVTLPEDVFESSRRRGYLYHPALLDGVLQLFGIEESRFSSQMTTIPRILGSFQFLRAPPSRRVYVMYSTHHRTDDYGLLLIRQGIINVGDINVFGEDGELIAFLRDYHCFSTISDTSIDRAQYFYHWQSKISPVPSAALDAPAPAPAAPAPDHSAYDMLAAFCAKKALADMGMLDGAGLDESGIDAKHHGYVRLLEAIAQSAPAEAPLFPEGDEIAAQISAHGASLVDFLYGRTESPLASPAARRAFFSQGPYEAVLRAGIQAARKVLEAPSEINDLGANMASRRVRVLELTRQGDSTCTILGDELFRASADPKLSDEPPMEYFCGFKPAHPDDVKVLLPEMTKRPLHLRHVPIDLTTETPGQFRDILVGGQFDLITLVDPAGIAEKEGMPLFGLLSQIRPLLAPGGLLVLLTAPSLPAWMRFVGADLAPSATSDAASLQGILARPELLLRQEVFASPIGDTGAVAAVVRADEGVMIPAPVPQKPGMRPTYVIFEDKRIAPGLIREALVENAAVIVVRKGDAWATEQDGNTLRVTVDKNEKKEDVLKLLELAGFAPQDKATELGRSTVGIFYCWALDDESEFVIDSYAHLTELARGLIELSNKGINCKCPVWILTEGSQIGGTRPVHGCINGLTRVLGNEVAPTTRSVFSLIDLPNGYTEAESDLVWRFSRAGYREDEVAIRDGRLLVPRFNRTLDLRSDVQKLFADDEINFRLTPPNDAQLNSLSFKSFRLGELREGEAIVNVEAAALNFRDLMVAQDLLDELSYERSSLGRTLGMECAGKLVALGPNTPSNLKVGDDVVAFGAGCLSNRIKCPARLVFKKPSNLSAAQASALLSVYMTTYYALIYLARMRKGTTVLIHSALGGVGLAAISLAKSVGAEFYATGGTPEKRERLMAMGAKGAFNSRNESWAEDIMAATGGKGVDIVLNSLAGKHIDLGVSVLRAGGRFCEIGKRDIYENKPLGLLPFRKNISYHAIDLDRLILDDMDLSVEFAETILDGIERGIYDPLPVSEYPMGDFMKPLRLMQKGAHTGKLVLVNTPRSENPNAALPVTVMPSLFRSDSTYVITGGLGGFGMCMIRWMFACGARHIAIAEYDRRPKREADLLIAEMAKAGNTVKVYFGDMSLRSDVEQCMQQIAAEMPTIRGIFHLAGVIRDANIMKQDRSLYVPVIRPKSLGALNLHETSIAMGLELDYFYMASSVAASIGSHSQANYAAANAYLDSLAGMRRAMGLKASVFNMGVISDTGMALRDPLVRKALKSTGIEAMVSTHAYGQITGQLRHDLYQTVGFLYDWSMTSETRSWSVYSHLVKIDASEGGDAAELTSFTMEDVLPIIVEQAQALTGSADIDPKQPLTRYGLDSFMGTELSVWLQKKYNVRVSQLEILTSGTCLSLARAVIQHHLAQSAGQSSDEVATAMVDHEDADEGVAAPVMKIPSQFALPKRPDHC